MDITNKNIAEGRQLYSLKKKKTENTPFVRLCSLPPPKNKVFFLPNFFKFKYSEIGAHSLSSVLISFFSFHLLIGNTSISSALKVMPQVKKEQKRCRKPENQHQLSSFSASNAAESRIQFSKNPKKKRFMFVKLKGLGCKGTPLTASASAPAIIRSAAEWEAKGARKRNQKKRKPLQNRRNPADNVVVDVPDVCCTPPGIGIASDVAPRATNPVPRLDHRKHSREARRNDDDVGAVLSVGIGSRTTHRSAEEIIEMLMSRQALLPGRILRGHDQYRDWRLDVDDMSYEELLDLGDKIGHVGTGLQDAQISSSLRKFKHFSHDATSLLVAGHHKDWECSICQEKCMKDDEMGILECGHHHHLECIKQRLLQKNACPVCKSAALRHKSK